MSALKKAVKLPHPGIEHLLCVYGHSDQGDPLQQLLAAEERGELAYPRRAIAIFVSARHYPANTSPRGGVDAAQIF